MMVEACTATASTQTDYEIKTVISLSATTVQDLDRTFPLPIPFQLDHAVMNTPVNVHARLVGPKNAPVVLVLGGISANRHVCDYQDEQGIIGQGWWSDLIGTGQCVDTHRYRILSFDFLPGNESSEALTITPADQARIAALVCDTFAISKLHAFLGASYGGMIALNFARLFPERLEQLITVCAGHRPHPMGAAWRSIQRKIVRFGLETQQPQRALSLARELGMTTYRTPEEFGERFSSTLEIESYLESRGQAFVGKMSPERYLSLSQSIDLHAVNPHEIPVPTTLIGFTGDQLVPVEEIRKLREQLPSVAGYFEFDSLYGHDGFLKEIPFLTQVIQQTLAP